MKLFIAPLWALLALFLFFSASAQDIIYTISGEINSQKTPLDSIAVENLTNLTYIGFGNLPERDDYRINLSRDEYWGSTSVNDMLNQSGLQIIKNLPGTLVVGYRGQKTLNANISLHNNKGQRLAFKENQVLENGSLVEAEIGNAGIYFLTISSPEETRSFKATGMLAAGNMNIATQSGVPIPLKSGQVYTLAGTGTEKGDKVKVSVFRIGYVAQPVELTVNGNETLVFPLEAPTPPEVQTLEATNILSNSATLNGNVVSEGNSPLIERGFYWSATNENPDEADNKIVVDGTTGSFSAELGGLNHATSYYVRAYAINEIGTSYGEVKSFTTNAILPTVITTAITNITQTTATSGGNVTSDGGAAVTERGICWNTTGNPTISDIKTTNGAGSGTFTSSITGLTANTTYYIRAYATNSQGTSYGNVVQFTTTSTGTGVGQKDTQTAVVDVTNPVTGATWMDRNLGASRAATSSTDAQAYGDLYQWGRAADGHQKRNSTITSTRSNIDTLLHGSFIFNYSNWRNPQNINLWQGVNGTNNPCPSGYRLPTEVELNNELQSWGRNDATGAIASSLKLNLAGFRDCYTGSLYSSNDGASYWSSTINGNSPRLLYFDRNNAHIGSTSSPADGYSVRCIKDASAPVSAPTVSTSTTSHIGQTTANLNGIVSSDSGSPVTERGFYWSRTNSIPGPADNKETVSGTIGIFNKTISGLQANTTYYVRAYANNSQSTNYGNTVQFTTTSTGDNTNGKDTQTAVVDVTNPATGKTWMDRNLGASRAAISSTDTEAYGDLYQWGRVADGHQKRNSQTTSTRSNSDTPGHENFIIAPSSPYDWRSTQNTNLWQGVNGTSNPCPVGYRLPTDAEWITEHQSWVSNNPAGAFASPLKLSLAGHRASFNGRLNDVSSYGNYWSSTVDGIYSRYLVFYSSDAGTGDYNRALGFSVRCLKDVGTSAILPTVTTSSITNITQITASCGGNVTSDSGANVTARGVCWSTIQNPTIANSKTTNGSGIGSFTSNITGLNAGITYYVRAYVTNSQGTSYGNVVQFTTASTDTGNGPKDTQTAIVDVTNPSTGKTWMDRNLGASRAATSNTDSEAYGDLYQWGRAADGHQKRNSLTTSTRSNSDNPGHSSFILAPYSPLDWLNSQNNNLWQGVSGINNPCPNDYRLPSIAEWNAERLSWNSSNAAGAFASPLKLYMAGGRDDINGFLRSVGSLGIYWSSTVEGSGSRYLYFSNINSGTSDYLRAYGGSVRCLKD